MSLTSVLCLKPVSLLQISLSLSYFTPTSYFKFLYFFFCFVLASCFCFCFSLALEILPPNFAFQISASPLNFLGTTHEMISSNYQMDCICLIVIITSSCFVYHYFSCLKPATQIQSFLKAGKPSSPPLLRCLVCKKCQTNTSLIIFKVRFSLPCQQNLFIILSLRITIIHKHLSSRDMVVQRQVMKSCRAE